MPQVDGRRARHGAIVRYSQEKGSKGCLPCLRNGNQTVKLFPFFMAFTIPFTDSLRHNIGGKISVEFYMQGSGRYTVPQMCALNQLSHNTFLQAQYLSCEAQDQSSEVCLCESGIDPEKFRQCVRDSGSLAEESAAMFQQVGVDVTPLIELGPKSTVFGVEDSWYLKKICTIFGDHQPPRGCVKPFACNGTEVLNARKALSQFDRCCSNAGCDATGVTTETMQYYTATTPLYT